MTFDTELYNKLRPYLRDDEEVLWIGKPAALNLPKRSAFTVIFAAFFLSFAIFWMFAASSAGGFFFLFGIPFVLVGAGMLYGTTIGHKNGLKNSVYAVTEKRAIILTENQRSGVNCKEYVLANLASVNLENVRDNVGTIRFEDVEVYNYDYGRYNRRRSSTYYPERELTTAFVMIDDVHTVYRIISDRLGS